MNALAEGLAMLRVDVTAWAALIFVAGCGGPAEEQAVVGQQQTIVTEGIPAAMAEPPRTRLIGSILNLFKGTPAQERQADGKNNSLFDADEKLQDVLGENSKRQILKANNKSPTAIMPVEQRTANDEAAVVPLINDAPLSSDAKAAGAGQKAEAAHLDGQ
jgi:hypothetical protein